ncbi:permease component of ribose/xylose/arabinose/galactoside ABC-type transporters [Sphaerochaeta pleomorpha str. Grapes]|uniref:Autoinducer 2 import system permease protein LsrC n=1 Tax=Sphaerochaeta pleomorpha (strain ATCC BAA-1885 / DSM 22778 / Grapes) TaxID=158190 RepID=G8QUN7_SPHPG|nr:ABC transporter permease [Sphaerochaeta pleomorpha]AEV30345.1 permease component of ribose/xylose/arabinose/galactoside ABC-type transporters [Sphaerochaeta pleomorpha str. Grapes]
MPNRSFQSVMKQAFARREATLIVLLVLLLVPITIRSPHFLSVKNISTILNDMAILVIVSIGEFYVILSNGIDLSVGSVIAFAGMACGMLNESHPEIPAPLLLLVGMGIGAILGLVNGVLVAYGKIPPIITTLGTVSIYRGMTFLLSKGTWVTAHEMSKSYIALPRNTFLGISVLLWIAFAVIALFYYFSRYTRTGREVYAIGGNANAAKFVGVSESRIRLVVFLVSGTLSGLAGALWTARYASAVNEMATGFEMQAVAACVLGGVNFAGGAGGIIGVAMGTLFLGVVTNALPVIYLSVFWQTFVQGFIVLIALALNTMSDQRKTRKLLAQRRG